MSTKRLWGPALKGIVPPMDKKSWDQLDWLSRMFISTRASVLIMTILSAMIAILLSIGHGEFHLFKSIVLLVSITLAHGANNILNDWSDWRRKVDEDDYYRARYGVEPLTHGLVTEREALFNAGLVGGLAALGGIYLISQVTNTGLGLALFGAGIFFLLFYTWPLKYMAMGELAVIIVWGPLMIGGGYFVITNNWSNDVVLAGLPYALGVTGVIFGKHIDKCHEDKAKRIYTLPVVLGEKLSRYLMIAIILSQYIITTYLVITGFFHPIMLIVWFTFFGYPQLRKKIPVWELVKIFTKPRPTEKPEGAEGWPLYFVAMAFVQNHRFGLIFMLGLIIQTIIQLI